MIYKMIMQVWQIPLGTTITKISGEKEYLIQDRMTVYADNPDDRQLILARHGTRFILPFDGRGSINVVTQDSEVMVYMEKWELLDLLNDEDDQ